MLIANSVSSVRTWPGARLAAKRSVIVGRARKSTSTAALTAAGTRLSNGLLGPGSMPSHSPRPASSSVITLIALVSRNSTAERSAIRVGLPPRSTSSHAPTATLPAPPSETAAPNASSLQGHPRAEPQRRAVEHLQEREHVADAGEDLQHDRHQQPAEVHVGDLVGDAVQAGHRQQQRDHQREQDDQRDQAAPQAPAGILVVAPARRAFEDDGSLGIIPESTKLVGALRHG